MEYLSSDDSIQHCRTENALERDKKQEMWFRFYIEDKTGVCIIDRIPHCLTENVLKIGKNQEMWLRYYIEDKNGVSIIGSIPHCHYTENAFKR